MQFEGHPLRIGATLQMGGCGDPDCRLGHLLLRDQDGVPFAIAPVTVEALQQLTTELRDFLYAKAAMRDDDDAAR